MKRQEMINTLRSMGWRPTGDPKGARWVGVQRITGTRVNLVYRYRQQSEHLKYYSGYEPDEIMPGQADAVDWHIENSPYPLKRWSNLCDDEVLRFYLKIMMEGL